VLHHDGTELPRLARFPALADPRIGEVRSAATNDLGKGPQPDFATLTRSKGAVLLAGLGGALAIGTPSILGLKLLAPATEPRGGLLFIGAGIVIGLVMGAALARLGPRPRHEL
jgi:hypothetical protein